MSKYYADINYLKVERVENPVFDGENFIFDTYNEAKYYLISHINNKILGLQSTITFFENKLDLVKILNESDLNENK